MLEALRAGVGGAVDDWVVLERRDWGFAPESITVPTVLVFGDADPIVPVAQGRDLARRIPDGEVIEIRDEGHLLILTRAGEILDALSAAATRQISDVTAQLRMPTSTRRTTRGAHGHDPGALAAGRPPRYVRPTPISGQQPPLKPS